ncbi:ADP-ribosylglycohydrolase family protein [Planctomycetota bacterium]
MGGPTECQHYLRIAKMFPDFQNHIRYDTPGTFFKLFPGYALDAAAGSVTDDTSMPLKAPSQAAELQVMLSASRPPLTPVRTVL